MRGQTRAAPEPAAKSLPRRKPKSPSSDNTFHALVKDSQREASRKLSRAAKSLLSSPSTSGDEGVSTSRQNDWESIVGKEEAQGMRQILDKDRQDGDELKDSEESYTFSFWVYKEPSASGQVSSFH